MTIQNETRNAEGLEPNNSRIYLLPVDDPKIEVPRTMDVSLDRIQYKASNARWVMLAFFVAYSASNAMQWVQYTIIQDIVVKYYGVPGYVVTWTSTVYMATYVPLIMPGSWLLDKTVSQLFLFFKTSMFLFLWKTVG